MENKKNILKYIYLTALKEKFWYTKLKIILQLVSIIVIGLLGLLLFTFC